LILFLVSISDVFELRAAFNVVLWPLPYARWLDFAQDIGHGRFVASQGSECDEGMDNGHDLVG